MNSKLSRNFLMGFTLLEIVIAMVILGLVAAGTFSLFVSSHQYISEAGHRLTAINYARQVAETLKVYVSAAASTPANANLVLANGTYNNTTHFSRIGLANSYIRDGITYNLNYTVSNVSIGGNVSGLRAVNITASWSEP